MEITARMINLSAHVLNHIRGGGFRQTFVDFGGRSRAVVNRASGSVTSEAALTSHADT